MGDCYKTNKQCRTMRDFVPFRTTRKPGIGYHPKRRNQVGMMKGQSLLIVDDEPTVCAMLAGMLRRLGFRTLQAYSARQALEIYRRSSEDIGLVITDVVMPVMNGPTLARHLQELYPQVKVFFMSGYMEKALWQCDHVRINEVPFLRKPFTAETLASTIVPMLGETRAARRASGASDRIDGGFSPEPLNS